MRRTFSTGVCLALILAVSGCGGSSKHEKVIKGMVEQMNALADALENVKDKDSAKAAAAKINKICDKMAELGKEAEGLPKLSKSEDEKLKSKYEPELKKAGERMQKVAVEAGIKSGGDPDFLKAMQRLQEVGKDLQKIEKK